MRFIETEDDLISHYGQPGDRALRKELRALDGHCRAFIAKSPFVLIGTQDAAGHGDVTPKGDRPGFAAVLDDTTLAIPDRPGNNRLDSFRNLIANPAVGLLFLIPGMDETLRVNGRGRITADSGLRERFAVDGKPAVTVLVVQVDACYMHCAKAFMRSRLWQPDSWPDRSAMPTLGRILKDQIGLSTSAEENDASLATAYAKTMW